MRLFKAIIGANHRAVAGGLGAGRIAHVDNYVFA